MLIIFLLASVLRGHPACLPARQPCGRPRCLPRDQAEARTQVHRPRRPRQACRLEVRGDRPEARSQARQTRQDRLRAEEARRQAQSQGCRGGLEDRRRQEGAPDHPGFRLLSSDLWISKLQAAGCIAWGLVAVNNMYPKYFIVSFLFHSWLSS